MTSISGDGDDGENAGVHGEDFAGFFFFFCSPQTAAAWWARISAEQHTR